MQNNTGTWDLLGSSVFRPQGDGLYTSLAIFNDIPIVAFADSIGGGSMKASVKKFNGTAWEYIGTAGISQGAIQSTSLAVYNTIRYLAFSDNGYISVAKFNGSQWEYIGPPKFMECPLNTNSYLAVANQIPYVAVVREGKISVMKYTNNAGWQYFGGRDFIQGYSISLQASDSGKIYIACSNIENGNKLSVLQLK